MEAPPNVEPRQAESSDRAFWVNLAILGAAIVLVYAVFHFRPFNVVRPENHAAVDEKLPIIELVTLDEAAKPLTRADLQGQVVLLVFWGDWNAESRQELPHLAKMAAQHADRPDFRVVPIACAQSDDVSLDTLRSSVQALLDQLEIDLTIYADPERTTANSFRAVARLDTIPMNYLTDRQGTIRCVWPGYREGVERQIAGRIGRLLEEPLNAGE